MKRLHMLRSLVLPLVLAATLAGCQTGSRPAAPAVGEPAAGSAGQATATGSTATTPAEPTPATPALDAGAFYYDLDHVVLYLDAYGELPANYVTKAEARAAGWEGGTPTQVFDGAAIGGDRFGNYEGNLPDLPRGSEYRECDLDTEGSSSRGAHRLIYTDDGDPTDGCGPYYYTEDHYETFSEVEVTGGEVIVHE